MTGNTVEYGRLGSVGVLTPAGNPTVEPELSRLLGDEALMLTARLHSTAPSLLDRLTAYADDVAQTLATFGSMPLDAHLFACTGSSYLIGPEAEDALVARMSASGAPFLTAAQAIRAAITALGARRVVLLNPYPGELRQAALTYWAAVGLDIAAVVDIENPKAGYHAIYTLPSALVSDALTRAAGIPADLVLLTGTGMATLKALAALPTPLDRPALSSNLCLGWMGLNALGAAIPIEDWLAAAAPWRRRVAPALT